MAAEEKQITFFIVAGEDSGDLHGGKLIRAIKSQHPYTRFVGHGGKAMKEAGMEILEQTESLAIMGFAEVVKHLPYMLNVMEKTMDKLREIRPDRIILIDYPGFNLRLSKKCKTLQIPITYFILPQLWAWKEGRIRYFKQYIEQSLCIFPFEQEWYEARGVPANFVGHPFSELTAPIMGKPEFFKKHGLLESAPVLTLLPGSRQQEINRHWPVFLNAVSLLKNTHPDLQVVVGKAPSVRFPEMPELFHIESNDVRAAMAYGTAAITASGTASLECAVMDTPEVVCYKLAPISFLIAKQFNKAPFVAMANLIAGREVVPELLQNKMTPQSIARACLPLLTPSIERKAMLSGFEEVRRTLGIPGVYERAAEAILMRTL